MSIITKDIEKNPYTGVRVVSGKVRMKTSEEYSWISRYFDGNPDYDQITDVTQGKIYDVVRVEGFGDGEDITIIDDKGNEQSLCEFFFEEVE